MGSDEQQQQQGQDDGQKQQTQTQDKQPEAQEPMNAESNNEETQEKGEKEECGAKQTAKTYASQQKQSIKEDPMGKQQSVTQKAMCCAQCCGGGCSVM
ncbi:hypothetical protein GGR56DRAFT_668531 [Xylariaceae sp. FL0804]|nr:hypothetical protein GGR56DRAFT_668531 [Xylariaceae sp. FL0804]